MNHRYFFLAIALICAGLLSGAVYLQVTHHLLPCPLCVGQRIAYWLIGLVGIVAFIHNPLNRTARFYSALMVGFALLGASIAIRQEWIIAQGHIGGCSLAISPEEKLLNAVPLAQWWPSMFEANGDCASVTWRFLSLSMPDWSLIWFALFVVAGVYLWRMKSRAG